MRSSIFFEIVLVGDSCVGKTSWLEMLKTENFIETYNPTIGAQTQSVKFDTNYDEIVFNIRDVPGEDKYGGFRKNNYLGIKGMIIMFDINSYTSYKNIDWWYEDVKKITGNIPAVIVANKTDIKSRCCNNAIASKLNIPSYEISTKFNYGFENPFLELSRQLTGHKDLVFTSE